LLAVMDAAVDRLEVKVVEAQDLRNVETGPPSPYAEVMVGFNSYATKNMVETKNPIWIAPAMSFSSLLANGIDAIIIYVKHKDIFTGKDTILGYASIPMSTYYGSPKIEVDAWYDLLNAGQSPEQNLKLGKIRTRITYFNELDDDVAEIAGQQAKVKPPNMLEVRYHFAE
jgi:C2 domain